jgi:hypothetical protein
MVPLSSTRISRVLVYSSLLKCLLFHVRDYHPLLCYFPETSITTRHYYHNWANPISLATTFGISVDFFSSGYLDVSVPRVCLTFLCIQKVTPDKSGRLPHSEILGSTLVVSSPRLIADYHVLHRLLPPRHSSYALIHLTI